MTDTAVTPVEGTPAQHEDEDTALLAALLEGQEANTETLASLGRDVHEIQTELTGAIRSFSASHGHRAAAERRIEHQLGLLVGQQREVLARLNRIESRMAGAELVLDELRIEPPKNGNGHGGE